MYEKLYKKNKTDYLNKSFKPFFYFFQLLKFFQDNFSKADK